MRMDSSSKQEHFLCSPSKCWRPSSTQIKCASLLSSAVQRRSLQPSALPQPLLLATVDEHGRPGNIVHVQRPFSLAANSHRCTIWQGNREGLPGPACVRVRRNQPEWGVPRKVSQRWVVQVPPVLTNRLCGWHFRNYLTFQKELTQFSF